MSDMLDTNGLAILGMFVTAIATSVGILFKVLGLSYKFGALVERVDLLFMMLFNRGQLDAIQKGWGTKNSPFQITTEGIDAIAPLLNQFIPWYGQLIHNRPGITEVQIFEAFERQFGTFIIERVCLPHHISNFACLIAVLEACKQHTQIEKTP